MKFKKRIRAAFVLSGLLALGVGALAQDNESYEGRLSPRPIDGQMRGQLTGVGEITAVLEGTELMIVGEFEGMRTPATGATLRRGLYAGVAGPAFADLEVVRGMSGLVYGSADLDRSLLESLEKGAIYVQIDGEEAEDGTLWGFLIQE